MKKVIAIVAAAAVGVLMLGLAQPESKPKEAPVVVKERGVAGLGFLKGTWSGKMGDDWVEETWSGPHGDSVIGMFRWQAGGKTTTMWELLSIKEEEGKPVLRMRRFDQKLNAGAGEGKEAEPMPAVEMSGNRVLFAAAEGKGGLKSVEYKCPSADVLEITVSFRDEGRAALEFDLARVR